MQEVWRVEMENLFARPLDHKSYEETTTVFGLDEEDSASKRRRKRRSLGRRVSFAEATAVHIFAVDDEYVSPSHDRKDVQRPASQIAERRSPRVASRRQVMDYNDKENCRPAISNLSDIRVRKRSKKLLNNVEQTIVNRAPTSSLTGDDGELWEFVDTRNTSFREEVPEFDEDVTLDSTTFTFKLSQLHNLQSQSVGDEEMEVEPSPSLSKSQGLRAGRESPASGFWEQDTNMSFTMNKPLMPSRIVDSYPGNIDGNSDMSITMQVSRRQNYFLATEQAEVIEILKLNFPTHHGDISALDAPLAVSGLPTELKLLHGGERKLLKVDEEIVVSEADSRADHIENAVTMTIDGGGQKENDALAAIHENGGREILLVRTTFPFESIKDRGMITVDHPEGFSDILHDSVVCHGYNEKHPCSPAFIEKTEATELTDICVSTISALVPVFEGYVGIAGEPDRREGSNVSSLQELVQQEGNAQKLLAILPEKEIVCAAGNEEYVLRTRSFVVDYLEENTTFKESEDYKLILTAVPGKVSPERDDNTARIAKATDREGEEDTVPAPGFPQELEEVSPGLTAAYENEEATLSMDTSVPPTPTAPLAHPVCKEHARELDRRITMDIPSLQDPVREEEDEYVVTDMKMDTQMIVSRRMSQSVCNSPNKANCSFQGSQDKPFEGELRITMDIPSLQDLVREEEDEDMVTDMKMDTQMVVSRSRMSESECNLPTKANCSFEGSQDNPLEGELRGTVDIPSLQDLLQEEEHEHVVTDMKMDMQIVGFRSRMSESACNLPTKANRSLQVSQEKPFEGEITGAVDIPSLQDLLQEEEDEDVVTEMEKDTQLVVSRSRMSESVHNLPTNANCSFQGSQEKPFEGVLTEVVEDENMVTDMKIDTQIVASRSRMSESVRNIPTKSPKQEFRETKRFLVEKPKQILNLQARIQSIPNKGEEDHSEKAAIMANEEKPQTKCALDKIEYLKEQLADVSMSRKLKLEKLRKRTQITEEAWRRSTERLESSQRRVHDLQIKLAENVRMGHSEAGVVEIAARSDFYVREMVNKVSLLKALQGGWQVRTVGQDIVELSYPPIIRRRMIVAESLTATKVIKSTWDLDLEKIELMFPGINAIQAFQRTLADGADYVSHNPKSLRSCIQDTRFLVSNFLMLMEEVGRCQNVRNAVVLVIPRFQIENDKHLQLEIQFLDCFLSVKFMVILDLRSAQLNGYPLREMPTKVDIKYCPPRVSQKLTSAALEGAIAAVEPGYHRVERLCATVGNLLASVKK